MDLGALGFWIFLAAAVVGGMWVDARKKAEKHETLRRIVEKTGTIDEAKLKELFSEKPAAEPKPGSGYRALRVLGTIVMFVAAAILTFFGVVAVSLLLVDGGRPMAPGDKIGVILAFAVPVAIAVAGWGLFYSSRFAEPPPRARNEPPAR
jgi:hypothetical protein